MDKLESITDEQTITRHIMSEKISKVLGGNFLAVLNLPQVVPKYTPETMDQYNTWQELCNISIALSSGALGLCQETIVDNIQEEK